MVREAGYISAPALLYSRYDVDTSCIYIKVHSEQGKPHDSEFVELTGALRSVMNTLRFSFAHRLQPAFMS